MKPSKLPQEKCRKLHSNDENAHHKRDEELQGSTESCVPAPRAESLSGKRPRVKRRLFRAVPVVTALLMLLSSCGLSYTERVQKQRDLTVNAEITADIADFCIPESLPLPAQLTTLGYNGTTYHGWIVGVSDAKKIWKFVERSSGQQMVFPTHAAIVRFTVPAQLRAELYPMTDSLPAIWWNQGRFKPEYPRLSPLENDPDE